MPDINQSVSGSVAKKPEVLMVGPDLQRANPGGVVTVMRDLMRSNISESVNFRNLPYDVNGSPLEKLMKYVRHRRSLKWEARYGNADILHFHTSFYPKLGHAYSFYAALAGYIKLRGGHSVVSLHGGIPSETAHAKQDLLRFLNAVDVVLVLTPRQQEELVELDASLGGKIRLVPNFTHEVSCDRLRDVSHNTFLFLGSLIQRKGVIELMEALAQIRGTLPYDFKLKIAGTGQEKATMLEMANKGGLNQHIEFAGYLNKEQKRLAICESTFLLIPSRSEAFPMAILESMSAGCIILGTSVGAVDLIIDGNGLICAPNSAGEIANTIDSALKLNSEERRRMSDRSRELFNTKYDLATSAADFYIDLYLSLFPAN